MTSSFKDNAVQVHDEQAPLFEQRYRQLRHDPYGDPFAYSRKKISEVCDRFLTEGGPGARLLDVGCGTGHQLQEYGRRGFSCAGCEPSTEMLHRARHLNPGVEIEQADLSRLPYPDSSFDVVVCIEVMRYLPDTAAGLREIRRVLRPGGLSLVSYAPRYSTHLYPLINKVTSRYQVGRLTKVAQYFHTVEDLEALYTDVGFVDAEVHARFLGPFIYVSTLSRRLGRWCLQSWERYDDRLSNRPRLRNFANVFVVSARRPV